VLPDLHEIRTADNVGIGYDAAGIGSRFLAFVLDTLIQGVVVIAAFIVVLAIVPDSSGMLAVLLIVLVPLFVSIGYFAVSEALTAGRTVGKRALGLRVIRLDGGAPGLREALVRNIARLIDLPLGIGVVVMFFDRRSRRIGDLAAGTVVVRERRAGVTLAPPVLPPPMLRTPDAGPAIDGVDRLGTAEWGALRTFLARQGMHPEQRARLAAVIAERLCERLELGPGAPERLWPPELLLERLYLQLLPRMAPSPPAPGMPV
jgi:uncharacterized RDD family membrane protein YckC